MMHTADFQRFRQWLNHLDTHQPHWLHLVRSVRFLLAVVLILASVWVWVGVQVLLGR
jgi:hypothetical protein